MVIAVRTEPGREGLEVVKEADTDHDRLRLSHEADMLRRAAHPGVVEVVDHGANTLRLRHRGTPLAHLLPLPADNAAAVVCAVAEIVEAMHDVGVAHGRIDGDHILLDDRGRPRLCGFGHAEPIVTPRSAAAADDADALGRLLNQLLDAAAGNPWSPALQGSRARTKRRKAREAFRNAAAMASRADPAQRISPRQMASAIRAALPRLDLPSPPPPEPSVPEPPRPPDRDRTDTIPRDVSPTQALLWTDEDLSFLKTDETDADLRPSAARSSGDPYAALADLGPDDLDDEIPGQLPLLDDRNRPARSELTPDERAGTTATVVDSAKAAEQAEGSGPPVFAPIKLREPTVTTKPPNRATAYLLVAVALLAFGGAIGILVTQVIPGSSNNDVSSGPIDADPDGDDQEPDQTPEPNDRDPIGQTTAPTTHAPGPSGPDGGVWPEECDIPAIAGPDLDDDGCPSEITLDGRLATVDGIEVSLGSAGDLVVVADVNCDGIATPFLLRPSSGEVFAFPEWAIEHAVEVTTMTVIDDATSITATPNPDGCGDVVAVQASGRSDDIVIARGTR